MLKGSHDHHQNHLQIKQDDKFYNRLLSKESSMANPSFRVYYGVAAGAVPFKWESQPGTPKHPSSTTTLPPLTPPPSYLSNSKKKPTKTPSRYKPFNNILPRLTLRKTHPSSGSSPSFSLSGSLSSSSSFSSYPRVSNFRGHSRFSSPRSSFSSRGEDEDQAIELPTSPSRFQVGHRGGDGLQGCNSLVIMKNAFLSIVGHGSSRGTA
ncbi:uncharacterized protein LOC143878917 [Tasmannia lanceolata]|uniref:uncharacterized protein LOC143878917 n=1 Tax=Tasmannia lanceolata TaxID=3420 RepID=UPI004063B2CB